MDIVVLIIGVILFLGLIVVHEFGHFIVATRNGVEAEEFAIFFGPTLYKRKTKKGWTFRFNLIPLGGYVKLKGEHDSDTEKGSYGAASLWVKTKIMAAGIASNLVVAVVLLVILALVGLPQAVIPNQFTIKSNAHTISSRIEITGVLSNTPASRAGLKSGDYITAIGTKNNVEKLGSVSSLQDITRKDAGKNVLIDYTRSGKSLVTQARLNTNASSGSQKIYLGVDFGASGIALVRYTWAAPVVAVGLTKQVIVLSFEGLGRAVKGLGGLVAGAATHNSVARKKDQNTASQQVLGPVGLAKVLKISSTVGFRFTLFLIALISFALAIVNVLPIPALDGGRLWFTLIAHAIKRPMSASTEEIVNAIGWVILLALIVLVTVNDIHRYT